MKRKDIEAILAEHPDAVFAQRSTRADDIVLTGEWVQQFNRWSYTTTRGSRSYTTTRGFKGYRVRVNWAHDDHRITGVVEYPSRIATIVATRQITHVIANSIQEYVEVKREEERRRQEAQAARDAAQGRTQRLVDEFKRLWAEASTAPVAVEARQGRATLTLTDEDLGTLNGYIDAALSITPHREEAR